VPAAPRPVEGPVRVTAAICTRNRPEQLRRALASLMRQAPQPDEVLIVDNAPEDDATRALAMGEFPQARYCCEPAAGLDVARNRALREATGSVVAFLDDDAVAEPGWVEGIHRVFGEEPLVGVCTARVEPWTVETPAQRLFEANGGFARGTRRVRLPADVARPLHGRRVPLIAWTVSVGSGASFAVRREVALALGGFDEALDRGPALPGGGDHDFFWRALQAGWHLMYEPEILARHEHRRDLAAVRTQICGHQRGLTAFLWKAAKHARGGCRYQVLAYLGWRLVKPGVRLARRFAGQDPLPAGLLLRMWGNSWQGLTARSAGRPRRGIEAGVGTTPEEADA